MYESFGKLSQISICSHLTKGECYEVQLACTGIVKLMGVSLFGGGESEGERRFARGRLRPLLRQPFTEKLT
jgi:hypothetical protein